MDKAKALAEKYGRPWLEMGAYERESFIDATRCNRCGEELEDPDSAEGCRDPQCPYLSK